MTLSQFPSCPNDCHKPDWLKATEMFSCCSGDRSLKSRCRQVHARPEGSGENPPLLSQLLGAPGVPWLVATLPPLPPSSRGCPLCVFFLLSQGHLLVFRPTQLIQKDPPLKSLKYIRKDPFCAVGHMHRFWGLGRGRVWRRGGASFHRLPTLRAAKARGA